jgi:quinol monooxygenase YgiN
MYGSIMRGRVKDGRREDFERLMVELSITHLSEHRGLVSVELAWEEDPNRVVMILHFQDRETYLRNADDPRTQRNYERWSALLDSEPEWIDVGYAEYIGEPRLQTVGATT